MNDLPAFESSAPMPHNFVAHLRILALERPDDIWLTIADEVDGSYLEQPIAYAVFERRVRALAAALQARFSVGERALIMLDNGEHYAICMLACFYSGVIAVPIFPPESTRPQHLARLNGVASDANASCVLTSRKLVETIAASGTSFGRLQAIEVDAIDPALSDAWQPFEPADEDVAFLQYTSGSTSTPKGVIVTHACLMANEHAMSIAFGVGPDSRYVTWAPLYHDMGLIGGLLLPLYCGIPVVLTSPRYFLERPVRWLELISRHRATHSGGPDFAFRLCLERTRDAQLAELDLSSWRCAYTGAEPVRADTERDFIARFAPAGLSADAAVPCYGLAEATLFVTASPCGDGVTTRGFNADALAVGRGIPDEDGRLLVSCGVVPPEHRLLIVEPVSRAPMAAGVIGEIWFHGPSVAAGYWNNERATQETFVERDGLRWLRTGDLGFVCEQGNLYVTGRMKDLIIVRGHNLYPQDIERIIEEEVDAVRKSRVAVFATHGVEGEGIGVSAEVSRNIQKLVSPAQLVEALSAAVSEVVGQPLSVVVLLNPGGLPKTTSGKLQRSACRAEWLDRSADAYAIFEFGAFVKGGCAMAAPALAVLDETEIALESLWRGAMRSSSDQPLARDAHFYASGGNSLSATVAAARIAKHWKIDFPVRLIFEHPRLHACAAAIRERAAKGLPQCSMPMAVIPDATRLNGLPLSHAQARQWFLWRVDPANTAYHMGIAVKIACPLDTDALQGALGDLVVRHESLRTAFRMDADGDVLQWILPSASVPLQLQYLSLNSSQSLDIDEDVTVLQALHEFKARPFDLPTGGLIRAALLRLSGDTHVLALTMHHIVSDGSSMQVLIDEIASGYAGRIGKRVTSEPALSIQYADYATWEREWLAQGERELQLAWWRQTLGDAQPILELSTDGPRRRQSEGYRAARQRVDVPAALLERLREVTRLTGTTLFVTLLTGLQVLLHRLTGEQDIRVGAPVTNRSRTEIERVVGLFVNTLVLRNVIDGRMSLASVLEQARVAVMGAQAHQDLPFEQLVSALHPERSSHHNPLFQVVFNHLHEDYSALQAVAGLEVHELSVPDLHAQFELVLEAREHANGGLKLDLIYAAELFEASSMERMAGHYLSILEALALHADQAVGDVPLLGDAERAELESWSRNPLREPVLEPVHQLIGRQPPDAMALLFGDESMTYGELDRRANRLAHRLVKLGVGPDVVVGIVMHRSFEMMIGILAILKAGGAYLPLDPEYPAQRLNYMVADSGISLLLTHRLTRDCIGERDGVRVLEADRLDLSEECESSPQIAVHGANLAYVIYTSGSTGKPKGAAVRHDALCSCMAWMQRSYGLEQGDAVLHKAPFGFDVSCWEIFWPLTTGARLVIANPGDQRDPARIVELIQRHQITTMNFVPAMLQAFLAHPGIEVNTKLRHIIVGGEAMPAQTQKQALQRLQGATLQNLYGPTETTIHVTRWTCQDDGQSQVPIGRPITDTQTYVLDSEMNLVPRGVAGELYLGGVSLARGYLKKPGLTAERFVANPLGGGERLYRTGDLVRWNGRGELEYLGRIDHQVKVRGFRIELGEIEAQLLAQPEIREAVVVSVQGPSGARLVAYVAPQVGLAVGASELRQRLSAVLPDYMVPTSVVTMEALPLNANGKVNRQALPEAPIESFAEYEAPRGALEQELAAVWADVLKVARVGRNDGFFELGGHSLLALQLLERVRLLGHAPHIRTLFEHPTLAAFAHGLTETAPSSSIPLDGELQLALDPAQMACIERAVPGGGTNIADIYPLSPLQEGMLFHHRLQTQGDTYVTPLGLSFASLDQLERFVAHLNFLIERHDTLRTAVLWEGLPEPLQVVLHQARLPLEWLELPETVDAAEALAAHVHPTCFRLDVRVAPMLRAIAARDARNDRWLLQIPSHHMALDNVSLGLILEEITALAAGDATGLLPSIPYRRHVARTRRASDGAAQEAFFRQMLGDVDEPTAPFDLLDIQSDGGHYAEARLKLSSALAQQVRSEAQRHGVVPASLFHLAWAMVLGQATGKNDVVFGTVLSGRVQGAEEDKGGVARAIGLFINTLPLRIRLGSRSVIECVRETHMALAQLLQHEHASLSLVQRCSALESGAPLFSALLNYRSNARGTKDLRWGDGVQVLGVQEFSNYPFDMSVDDLDDEFELIALIDRRVDAHRICAQMQSAVAALVRSLISAPMQAIGSLDLLPPSELALLDAWGVNSHLHDAGEAVHRLIERQARETPDAIALIFEQQVLTHAELNTRANRLAHYLIQYGVQAEDRVGIALERSIEMVVGVLAVLKAGAVYVPLDPAYPEDRIADMMEDSAVALLLTQSGIARNLAHTSVLAVDELHLSDLPAHDPQVPVHSGQLAYLIYTSGSTGRPKGVGITHGALVRHTLESIRFFNLRASDRMLQFATLNFDGFIEQTFAPLAVGAAIVLRGPSLWDSETFYRAVIDQQISVADLTTAYWLLLAQDFARHGVRPMGALRQVHVGGEAMPTAGLDAWREAGLGHIVLLNTYGPTEATVTASVLDCSAYLHGKPVPQRLPIGTPLAGRELRVLGNDFTPVPHGVAGELCIGGELLARGYWGRAGLSAERFVADPFSCQGGRLYRTGDLVRWNEAGELEYLGRRDHQVKIRGFRVELGEVETRLLAQPGVREAVVVAHTGVSGISGIPGLQLVGYVSGEVSCGIHAVALREQLKATLPDYMVPSSIVVLDALPLTTNGKIDRKALPAPQVVGASDRGEAPREGLESALAVIWSEVLGVAQVGREDSFFELGGHSLLALRLMERIRQIGHAAPVRTLFEHPSLAAFASALERASRGDEPVLPVNEIPEGCTDIEPFMLTLVDLDAAQIAWIEASVPGGAANIADIYPLAPMQEGMLFHHLLQTQGDAYVTPLSLAFDTRERLKRFVDCINQVIVRHDILRTLVLWEGVPDPVQVVLREARLQLEWPDISPGMPDMAAALAELVDPAHYRIDVREAPMIRALAVHDVRGARWLMQLPSHHLILDHATLELLVEEIASMEGGPAVPLPEPVPFRHFVAQALLGVSKAEHEAFFTRMLGDMNEPTAPFGLMDVRGDGTRVREGIRRLPHALSQHLRAQARRHGVSAATLFHLAWALVLAATTGRDDVVFGTVLFGRMQGAQDSNRAWGLFINTLPLRVRLGSNSVLASMRQTHESLTQLLHHEHAGLSLAQRCSGVSGGAPLFTSLLNYRYTKPTESGAELLAGMQLLSADERTNYPFTLSVDDLGEDFEVVAQISEAIDADRICQMMQVALDGLAQALSIGGQRPVCEINPIPALERAQIESWSINAQNLGAQEAAHVLFARQAEARPDAVALLCADRALSYSELNTRANRVAHRLRRLGVKPESRVGIAMERSIEMVVGLLAVLKAGGAYVPLDPEYPVERLQYMLSDSGIEVLLTQSHLAERMPVVPGIQVVLALDTLDVAQEPEDNPTVTVHGESLAYVIYTSGSTGKPKGAANRHGALNNRLAWMQGAYALQPGETVLQKTPFSFDVSVWEFFWPLMVGARLVLAQPGEHRDPARLVELIRRHAVSTLHFVPSMLQAFLSHAQVEACTSLHRIVCSGEALPAEVRAEVIRRLPWAALYNLYGPTETAIDVTHHHCIADISSQVPIGEPISGLRTWVLDGALNAAPQGVPGELYLGGVGLGRGYVDRAGLTAERFVADPFGGGGERLYRTGDLVRWNGVGQLEYLGRLDHQVKVRGFRIELGEIEAQLLAEPMVREAVVVARPSGVAAAPVLVAYVSLHEDVPSLDILGLRERLARALPDYMVPHVIERLDTLPLNSNGKVDRRSLPEPTQTGARRFEEPQGEIESSLGAIWCELLGVSRVGRDDHFFELGGHSLMSIQMMARVEAVMHAQLSIKDIFVHPILKQMADVISDGGVKKPLAQALSDIDSFIDSMETT